MFFLTEQCVALSAFRFEKENNNSTIACAPTSPTQIHTSDLSTLSA